MADKLTQTRIVKRLAPDQAGALKHARRYGDALVCVRYRHDAKRQTRYTTVELVVDEAPLAPRSNPDHVLVCVRIAHSNSDMRSRAMALGAQWSGVTSIWIMTRKAARTLGLKAAEAPTRP